MLRPLNFRGANGTAELNALFDSGFAYSCLNPEIAARLGTVESLPEPLDVNTAFKGRFIRFEKRISLDFYLNNLRLTDEFMVVPGLSEEAIIGATTMQKWRIKLDFEHDKIITDARANWLILK